MRRLVPLLFFVVASSALAVPRQALDVIGKAHTASNLRYWKVADVIP